MAEPVPIACSLDGAQLSGRAVLVTELGRDLTAVEAAGREARLCFSPARRVEVESFIEAESACCPFFELGLAEGPDGAILSVVAPAGGEWAVRGLAARFGTRFFPRSG